MLTVGWPYLWIRNLFTARKSRRLNSIMTVCNLPWPNRKERWVICTVPTLRSGDALAERAPLARADATADEVAE